jgi:hypothetical protein
MALTAAEKQRAYRERTKAERKVVEPGELLVVTEPTEIEIKTDTMGATVSADALMKLVDELYLAGMFRGSLARIKLRAFAKGE